MNLAELETVVAEAARDLAARHARPLPATVVLPLPEATQVTSLPDFPDDDAARHDLLARFAADRMRPANAPCYGFIAEGTVGDPDAPTEVVVVVVGARRQPGRVTAAPLGPDGLGAFWPSEELHPAAFPFLAPLQEAADAATPPDVTGGLLQT